MPRSKGTNSPRCQGEGCNRDGPSRRVRYNGLRFKVVLCDECYARAAGLPYPEPLQKVPEDDLRMKREALPLPKRLLDVGGLGKPGESARKRPTMMLTPGRPMCVAQCPKHADHTCRRPIGHSNEHYWWHLDERCAWHPVP